MKNTQTTPAAVKRTLIQITVLAAFEPKTASTISLATLGEAAADLLRDFGALTATTTYDAATVPVAGDPDDADTLHEALDQQFPSDGLMVGPLPAIRMLGRNGLFRHARLTRVADHFELWLGTAKERFPLLSFLGRPEK